MAENIYRLLRIINDKSIQQLADEMGVTSSYISAVENDKKKPSSSLLEKYGKILGVRPSTILYFAEENQEQDLNYKEALLFILKNLAEK